MTDKKRIFFVINPVSGANRKEDVPQLIKDNLNLAKFEFDYKKTERKGHATYVSLVLQQNIFNRRKENKKRDEPHSRDVTANLPYTYNAEGDENSLFGE